MDFSAATESIFTNHPQRDAHLRSMDFFDVSLYPRIHFKAVRFDMDQKYMIGDLTIKGTTRQITLQTELGGAGTLKGTCELVSRLPERSTEKSSA